jgi:hypothetical protein
MRCRVIICAACCTRVNGVNHCHACLKALGAGREETRSSILGMLLAGVLFCLGWILLFAICWTVSGKMAP